MNRYLMLLGVAIIVFCIAGGSLEIANGYNQYQSHVQVSGPPGTSPLNVFDEVQWQFARLVGGGIIMAGLVSGSILMGLSWIARILEQLRDSFATAPPKKIQS